MSIFQLLIQFVFRITFGVALAMAVTPSRWVSAGFYRVHLWVLMGLNTLASLTIYTQRESLGGRIDQISLVLASAIGLAATSYFGSVIWLFGWARLGLAALSAIAVGGLTAAVLATAWNDAPTATDYALGVLSLVSSGLLLGVTLCAMFLGHWYLNTPTMEMKPLKRLVRMMLAAVLIRGAVSGAGLVWHVRSSASLDAEFWIFVALRWLSGLIGALLLAAMTWQTLKIPNTQSATGILYAAVILTFIGELTAQFLSWDATYPL